MIMDVYQLVESDCVWNPYGIKRMAPAGEGRPVTCMADGPCCIIRFRSQA